MKLTSRNPLFIKSEFSHTLSCPDAILHLMADTGGSQSFIHQVRILSQTILSQIKGGEESRNPLFIKSEFSHNKSKDKAVIDSETVAILYSSSQNSLHIQPLGVQDTG